MPCFERFCMCSTFIIAGRDFNGTSPLKQTFASGSNAGQRIYFYIDIYDDVIVETDESFVTVVKDTDLLVKHNTSVVRIMDDDSEENALYLKFHVVYLHCFSFSCLCQLLTASI